MCNYKRKNLRTKEKVILTKDKAISKNNLIESKKFYCACDEM